MNATFLNYRTFLEKVLKIIFNSQEHITYMPEFLYLYIEGDEFS